MWSIVVFCFVVGLFITCFVPKALHIRSTVWLFLFEWFMLKSPIITLGCLVVTADIDVLS